MQPLVIVGIVALVIAAIIAIVVWSIVIIEYRKILRQRKIDRLIERIRDRAEDSGNESEGGSGRIIQPLVEMGHHGPWDVDDLEC
ncbi:vpu protein [Human immunodeficiency virus 1]|uniref:Protein Vpu n=1 Tax=Human immunodeficiency virus type 1 TaxID=11676 RepID=A0A0U2X6K2_HV1|nr:vpu protein [Human immunodeficiency virus 1]